MNNSRTGISHFSDEHDLGDPEYVLDAYDDSTWHLQLQAEESAAHHERQREELERQATAWLHSAERIQPASSTNAPRSSNSRPAWDDDLPF